MGIEDIQEFYAGPEEYPTFQTPPENLFLYSLVLGLRPRRVLEIGTLYGGSVNIIAKALDEVVRVSRAIIAMQASNRDGESDAHLVEAAEVEARVITIDPLPAVKVDQEAIAHRATFLTGYSPGAIPQARELAGADFDLCFIDGSHAYMSVLADIVGVLPYMAPESYLLFHDAYYPEVARAVDDALAIVTGLIDCGIVCRYQWSEVKFQGSLLPGPWMGMRLVRVQPPLQLRTPIGLIHAFQALMMAATQLGPTLSDSQRQLWEALRPPDGLAQRSQPPAP